jgi:hypothetical protein
MKRSIMTTASLPLFLLMGVATCKSRQAGEPGSTAVIHYIPFSVQTMVATTPNNIEKQAFHRFNFDTTSAHLNGILTTIGQTQPGSSDDRVVRMKLALSSGQVFLVDAKGAVRSFSGESRLTEPAFARLKELMAALGATGGR